LIAPWPSRCRAPATANYDEKSRHEGIARENQGLAEERLLRFRKRAYWSDMNLA